MIKDLMKDYTGSQASFQNPELWNPGRVLFKMKEKSMKQGIAMEYPYTSFLQQRITILLFLKASFQLANLKFHNSIFFFPNLTAVYMQLLQQYSKK